MCSYEELSAQGTSQAKPCSDGRKTAIEPQKVCVCNAQMQRWGHGEEFYNLFVGNRHFNTPFNLDWHLNLLLHHLVHVHGLVNVSDLLDGNLSKWIQRHK